MANDRALDRATASLRNVSICEKKKSAFSFVLRHRVVVSQSRAVVREESDLFPLVIVAVSFNLSSAAPINLVRVVF